MYSYVVRTNTEGFIDVCATDALYGAGSWRSVGQLATGREVQVSAIKTNKDGVQVACLASVLDEHGEPAVSYTHLTLPTIYSV